MTLKSTITSGSEGLLKRREYLGLFLLGLLVALAAASLQRAPGYMDAEYYFAGALRIVSGQPASEPYLWNYLNNPASLPAPSFSYWMPLPSVVAALGLALARPMGFAAARMGFVLAAACVPPLAALLSFRMMQNRRLALLAGILAAFPGFYLPFLTVTDAFPLFMLLGGLFLLNASSIVNASRTPMPRFVLAGFIAGLLHMARADGLLWLGAAGLVILLRAVKMPRENEFSWRGSAVAGAAAASALVMLGYVLAAAPWYLHNLREWGALMPPGGARAVWITEYEQTMIYPPEQLNTAHWLAAGWGSHLRAVLVALGGNFQTALAVQGGIILFPFMLLGLWKLRRRVEVQVGVSMWLVTAAVMTLAFPFAGINGGFFHSGAGVQPLLWAAAPAGLEMFAGWYAEKRHLKVAPLLRFFSGVALLVCMLLSAAVYFQRVIGDSLSQPRWSASSLHYQEIETVLRGKGAVDGEAVLVNNPPGFWLASGRPAAVIPYGDENTLLAAAHHYGARYIVLEVNNPHQLAGLYHGAASPPGLEYIASVGPTKIYRVLSPETSR